jgi:hypothetical protein
LEWDTILDWQGNSPDLDEVVRFFKANNIKCRKRVEEVKEEIKEFLALSLDDSSIKKFAESAGVYLSIKLKASGYTYRQWFERMLEILEEPGHTTYLKIS